MAKWRCDDCVDNENTKDSCVLDLCKEAKPDTCPYSGTDCYWLPIEENDNGC